MRIPKRALLTAFAVLLGATALAGCFPRTGVPLPEGTLWEVPASCTWGSEKTVGNAAKGTVTLQTEVCWDDRGKNVDVRGIRWSCNPGAGWTLAVGQKQEDNTTHKYSAAAVCRYVQNGNAYEVIQRHSWATSGRIHLYRQGCSATASDPRTYCSEANPLLWSTYGFEHETIDARVSIPPPPTTPPPAPRRVSGSVVPASADVQLKLNNTTPVSLASGTFNHTLPNAFPGQNLLTLTAPAGYSVFYTACSNKTDCHGSKTPQLGNTVTVNPDNGGYLDVRWYVRRNGTIQGYKMVEHIGASVHLPAIVSMKIWLDGNLVAQNINPYILTNIPPGRHTIRAERPAGWDLGYTLCYNSTNCHSDWPHGWIYPPSNNEVTIDVPEGGFVDLYWHYYPQ